MNLRLVIAGFGGQGILFTGKVIAYAGMLDGNQVSWLPSYGPEMRGGTANCAVCISEQAIRSPLVSNPDILIALNNPSLEKFGDTVKPNGLILCDTNTVTLSQNRNDIKFLGIPATNLAEKNSIKGLSNMILLGLLYSQTKFCTESSLFSAIRYCTPARKSEMLELNFNALKLGFSSIHCAEEQ